MGSHFVDVDGIRTHYLEAGSGPNVVLLHGGEFGGCSELSWEHNFNFLARQFRVIAPDWLGYGQTAKLHDFEGAESRRVRHLQRFLALKHVNSAHFIGNSMGGSVLSRTLAHTHDAFSVRSLVLISAGGFAPENEWRRALTSYDGTMEGMRAIVAAMFFDPKWAADENYVSRRHRLSLVPGAWECAAASRFKNPQLPHRLDFGRPDETPYEAIQQPVLIIAGANDKLRKSNYTAEFAPRIPDVLVHEIPDCGHCPQIERADIVNPMLKSWILRQEGMTG